MTPDEVGCGACRYQLIPELLFFARFYYSI